MRLARRLSIAISLGICLVLSVNAWIRLQQERQDYRDDLRRNHATIGRNLASAVEFVWAREGEEAALQAVEHLNRRDNRVSIQWVWTAAPEVARKDAPLMPELIARRSQDVRSAIIEQSSAQPHVLTYVSVKVPDGRLGAIQLDEALAPDDDVLRGVLFPTLSITAALLALSIGLTFGLCQFLIARPLRALKAKAERIGSDDLSEPLVLDEDNEIRDLANTMNEMCDKVSRARVRVEKETSARILAMEQLRHADRLRTVGELASGIAHQLGTPLNVVRARGSMIAAGEIPEARMRELGAVIVEHVDRMSETIWQVLDFARRAQPKLTSCDLARTVERVLQLVEPLAHQRRVKLSLALHTESAPLRMDAGQLHQAITNIVVNAIHATPESGAVEVELTDHDQTYSVDVRDGGAGIAPENLPHVFEPFFTTKRAGEGTGLGLSIADGVVKAHGGKIDVQSVPGRGTVFRLSFPKIPLREARPSLSA